MQAQFKLEEKKTGRGVEINTRFRMDERFIAMLFLIDGVTDVGYGKTGRYRNYVTIGELFTIEEVIASLTTNIEAFLAEEVEVVETVGIEAE